MLPVIFTAASGIVVEDKYSSGSGFVIGIIVAAAIVVLIDRISKISKLINVSRK